MTYSSESEASGTVDLILPHISDLCSTQLGSPGKPNPRELKKNHSCNFSGCSAKFSRPWRLAAHEAVHLGQKPFPCDIEGCDKAYTSNYHLRRHKLASHVSVVPERLYKCHYPGCKKEFKFIQNEKKHFRRTHEEKTCKTCGEQFFKYIQLKKHMKIHSTGYLFRCQKCDLKFQHEFWYRRHLRRHWLHVCPVKGCTEAFHNWSDARKHLATHPYDYVCAYCKKGYRRRRFLKIHIFRHLNGIKRAPYELKKFSCDLCQIEVLGKASLKRHIRNVHEAPKEKNIKKSGKMRAPRKDKGIPKRSLAVVLSNIVVPKEIEQQLIKSDDNLEFCQEVYSQVLESW